MGTNFARFPYWDVGINSMVKNMIITVIVAYSCLVSVCITHAIANDNEITWLITNWPPWMILEGDDRGTGRFNHILALAQKELSQYRHLEVKMNWSRVWFEISQGKHICNIFAYKTDEREKIAYFSEPHTFVLPNAIIMKHHNIQKMGNPTSYSIVSLLKDNRFNGIIERTRSFSFKLDGILEKHLPGSNLIRKSAKPESLIKMVDANRIDYTIEYPIVASYFDQKVCLNKGFLSSILIEELPLYNTVCVACPKNEWGKKVINRWNNVFRKLKRTDRYRKITEMGHNDERELSMIREYYDTFLKIKK